MNVRWRLLLLVVGMCALGTISESLYAAPPVTLIKADVIDTAPTEMTLLRAQTNYVSARTRFDRYVRFEHPRAVQRLDATIRLATAEIDVIQRRVNAYRNISTRDSNDATSPVFLTKQRLHLALEDARLHLADLEQKRCELIQTHRDRRRVLRLEYEIARRRMTALLPQPEEIPPPRKQ